MEARPECKLRCDLSLFDLYLSDGSVTREAVAPKIRFGLGSLESFCQAMSPLPTKIASFFSHLEQQIKKRIDAHKLLTTRKLAFVAMRSTRLKS